MNFFGLAYSQIELMSLSYPSSRPLQERVFHIPVTCRDTAAPQVCPI